MPNLIEIIISGKNEAKAAMAEAKKDSVSLSSTVSKLGVVSGAALVGIGVEAVRMATTYETATTRLVTSAGESTKNIDMVRQGMLNMAGWSGRRRTIWPRACTRSSRPGITARTG